MAGAAVNMFLGTIEKGITATLKYNNEIKKLRRSIRRAIIATFKGKIASYIEDDKLKQKRAAVLSKIREIVSNSPNPKDFNEIKYEVKMADDLEKPKQTDCAPVVDNIVTQILQMLASSSDTELIDLVETCTPKSLEEFNDKIANKLNPSSFTRLMPALKLIADSAGFKIDGVNAVTPPSVVEMTNDLLANQGKNLVTTGTTYGTTKISNEKTTVANEENAKWKQEVLDRLPK
jgi:hypothetical protein